MSRIAVIALVICGTIFCKPEMAHATSYAKCAPSRATLIYDWGPSTIQIDVAIRKPESICDFVTNVNVQRPLSVKIRYAKHEYSVPEICLKQIHLDLDGIEVQPEPGYLTVWFGPSIDRVSDFEERARSRFPVKFDDEGFVSCRREQ